MAGELIFPLERAFAFVGVRQLVEDPTWRVEDPTWRVEDPTWRVEDSPW